MIGFTMKATERAVFGEVSGVDRRGNPAGVENVRYTVEPGSEQFLEWQEEDGVHKLRAVGPVTPSGQFARAKITADVNLDPGVESDVDFFIDVEIIAGNAVALSVAPPTIEESPE
jgi:hypothetical protein